MGNDPTCEVQKAAQNQIYDANQAACEVAKEAEVAGYQSGIRRMSGRWPAAPGTVRE